MQMVHRPCCNASSLQGTDGTLLLFIDTPPITVLSPYTKFLKIELYGMFSSENGKWGKMNL